MCCGPLSSARSLALGEGDMSGEEATIRFVSRTVMKTIASVNFICLLNNSCSLIALAVHLKTKLTPLGLHLVRSGLYAILAEC